MPLGSARPPRKLRVPRPGHAFAFSHAVASRATNQDRAAAARPNSTRPARHGFDRPALAGAETLLHVRAGGLLRASRRGANSRFETPGALCGATRRGAKRRGRRCLGERGARRRFRAPTRASHSAPFPARRSAEEKLVYAVHAFFLSEDYRLVGVGDGAANLFGGASWVETRLKGGNEGARKRLDFRNRSGRAGRGTREKGRGREGAREGV